MDQNIRRPSCFFAYETDLLYLNKVGIAWNYSQFVEGKKECGGYILCPFWEETVWLHSLSPFYMMEAKCGVLSLIKIDTLIEDITNLIDHINHKIDT